MASSTIIADPGGTRSPRPKTDPDLINALPDGCLTIILSRVGPRLDLGVVPRNSNVWHPIHCSLVCRRWAELANHAVKDLHFLDTTHAKAHNNNNNSDASSAPISVPPSLGPSLARFPSLTSLRFSSILVSDMASVLRTLAHGACPRLEAFSYTLLPWSHALQDLDGLALGYALLGCPALQKLEIQVRCVFHCRHLNAALRELRSLESLTFAPVHWYEEEGLHGVHEGLKQLKFLVIKHQRNQPVPMAASPDGLPSLKKLKVHSCHYTELPPALAGWLPHLRSLDLFSLNWLTSLPESLGRMRELEKLNISFCRLLTALPESLGDLARLRKLSLSYCNGLLALPAAALGRLAGLERLHLMGCDSLQSLPESVGKLLSLRELSIVSCNAFQSLPESIGSLPSLGALCLHGNEKMFVLPERIGSLAPSLRRLQINLHAVTRLPGTLWQLRGLTELILGLKGEFPDEGLGNLEDLRSLTLWRRSRFPKSVAKLDALETLELRDCSIPRLPYAFGGLRRQRPDVSQYWCYLLGSLSAVDLSTVVFVKPKEDVNVEGLNVLVSAVVGPNRRQGLSRQAD